MTLINDAMLSEENFDPLTYINNTFKSVSFIPRFKVCD